MGGLSACSRWLSEGAPQQTRFECGSWGSVSHQVPNCRAKCLLVSPHPLHGHVAVIGFLVTHDCQANGRFPGTSLPTQLSDGGGMFGKNSLFPVLVTLCLLPESSVQLYFVCANTFIVIHSFIRSVDWMLVTGRILCRTRGHEQHLAPLHSLGGRELGTPHNFMMGDKGLSLWRARGAVGTQRSGPNSA